MDAAVPIPPRGMVHILDINLQLLPPKLTYEHTHDGSHDRTFTIRPIILTHGQSTDHLITRTMLSIHRTTLAFVAQGTHQDVRHIARSITYRCTTVAYWRFNTCVLSYDHFFHVNTHKTVCEFLHSHDILVASNRATIVTGPLPAPCSRTRTLPWLLLSLEDTRSV